MRSFFDWVTRVGIRVTMMALAFSMLNVPAQAAEAADVPKPVVIDNPGWNDDWVELPADTGGNDYLAQDQLGEWWSLEAARTRTSDFNLDANGDPQVAINFKAEDSSGQVVGEWTLSWPNTEVVVHPPAANDAGVVWDPDNCYLSGDGHWIIPVGFWVLNGADEGGEPLYGVMVEGDNEVGQTFSNVPNNPYYPRVEVPDGQTRTFTFLNDVLERQDVTDRGLKWTFRFSHLVGEESVYFKTVKVKAPRCAGTDPDPDPPKVFKKPKAHITIWRGGNPALRKVIAVVKTKKANRDTKIRVTIKRHGKIVRKKVAKVPTDRTRKFVLRKVWLPKPGKGQIRVVVKAKVKTKSGKVRWVKLTERTAQRPRHTS